MTDPAAIPAAIISRLESTIAERRGASPDSSYVASLCAGGIERMSKKLGEEAVETVIAAISQGDDELVGESADLLFHLLVLLSERGISFDSVLSELARREGLSGIEEKAARKT